MKLRKFNELMIVESFIQINLFKGFTYIDKAGEIVNAFYTDNVPPKFEMQQSGLVIYEPDDDMNAFKVTPKYVWGHYLEPITLDKVITSFYKKFKEVTTILNVDKIERIGWRSFFIFAVQSKTEMDKMIKKYLPSLRGELVSLACTHKVNELRMNIKITPVKKRDGDKGKNGYGIMFDIDVYQTSSELTDRTDVKGILNQIRDLYKKEEALEIVRSIIQ